MKAILTKFEEALDPRAPERTADVIGYGEISTVFAVAGCEGVVLKRMGGFRSPGEVEPYCALVSRYLACLQERGVDVVPTETVHVAVNGRHVVYLVQPRLPAEAIGNAVLKNGGDEELRAFLRGILDRVRRVVRNDDAEVALGLDAQISNWGWQGGKPVLLDVSTPILRERGREAMDPELVLRSMPRPLAWVFERVALPTLLDRYHHPREVAKDLAANFIKEGRADRVPLALEEINGWLDPRERPLSVREVERAYAADARLWTAFQAVRRLDRAVTTRLLGRRYEYILPGPVRR